MLTDHLATETSYDQLPNFTAADILRLTGIGRNQYISLLHQTHPKSSLSRKIFGRASLAYKLPHYQKRVQMEDWWMIMPGYPTEMDVDSMTLKSKWTLDKLIRLGFVWIILKTSKSHTKDTISYLEFGNN